MQCSTSQGCWSCPGIHRKIVTQKWPTFRDSSRYLMVGATPHSLHCESTSLACLQMTVCSYCAMCAPSTSHICGYSCTTFASARCLRGASRELMPIFCGTRVRTSSASTNRRSGSFSRISGGGVVRGRRFAHIAFHAQVHTIVRKSTDSFPHFHACIPQGSACTKPSTLNPKP